MNGPWTISEAREASRMSSAQQRGAESTLKQAGRDLAEAERVYRLELTLAMTRIHTEDKVGWSSCGEIARGDQVVGDLRYKRDVCEAVYEAAKAALWRLNADRRDVHQYAAWSMRADLRDDGTHESPDVPAIGRRAA